MKSKEEFEVKATETKEEKQSEIKGSPNESETKEAKSRGTKDEYEQRLNHQKKRKSKVVEIKDELVLCSTSELQ